MHACIYRWVLKWSYCDLLFLVCGLKFYRRSKEGSFALCNIMFSTAFTGIPRVTSCFLYSSWRYIIPGTDIISDNTNIVHKARVQKMTIFEGNVHFLRSSTCNWTRGMHIPYWTRVHYYNHIWLSHSIGFSNKTKRYYASYTKQWLNLCQCNIMRLYISMHASPYIYNIFLSLIIILETFVFVSIFRKF